MRIGRDGRIFHQHRRRDIAEDEMAVAVAPVEMTAGDFRADDQHALRVARTDVVRRSLDTEGRRRTRDVHIEGETLDAQFLLDLDRHGRIGALHVRRGAQHRIDVGNIAPRLLQRLARSLHADLGHERQFLVRTLGQARLHRARIEDRFLRHHMARLDPAGLLDEFDRTRLQRSRVSCRDRIGVLGIEPFDIAIEAVDEFFVGDGFRRRKQPGGRDDRAPGQGLVVTHAG